MDPMLREIRVQWEENTAMYTEVEEENYECIKGW